MPKSCGRWRRSAAPTQRCRCSCGARASPSAGRWGRAGTCASRCSPTARAPARSRSALAPACPSRDGVPADATFTLEVNEWRGVSEPRLVLRHARAAELPALAPRPLPRRRESWCSSPERRAIGIGRTAPARKALPLRNGDRADTPGSGEPHKGARAIVRDRRAAQRVRAPPARRPVRDRLRARRRHDDPDRPRARGRGVRVRLRAPRRAAAQVGRGLHRAPGRRRPHLRGDAPGHRDALRGAAARHRGGHLGLDRGGARALRRGGRQRRRRRHEADRHHLPLARRGAGGELPQDDGGDGHRRAGDPDQARRPAAQHAHDRCDAQAEADRQGEGDAGDLRADRASAGHPRDQVGARGPRVRDPAPPQVPGDQGVGRPAARGARELRERGRRVPDERAAQARHRGADRRARQALLLDLREDDQEGTRVQRDLRPHRDARDRGLREGLLRRGGGDPLAVEAAAGALQGLHRDAQVQHVPVAAHHCDRAGGTAAGDPDPHGGDARDGGVRGSGALDVQAASARSPSASAPARSRTTPRSSGCARCSTGSRTCPIRKSSWRA